jgi:hypothetical protein
MLFFSSRGALGTHSIICQFWCHAYFYNESG